MIFTHAGKQGFLPVFCLFLSLDFFRNKNNIFSFFIFVLFPEIYLNFIYFTLPHSSLVYFGYLIKFSSIFCSFLLGNFYFLRKKSIRTPQ